MAIAEQVGSLFERLSSLGRLRTKEDACTLEGIQDIYSRYRRPTLQESIELQKARDDEKELYQKRVVSKQNRKLDKRLTINPTSERGLEPSNVYRTFDPFAHPRQLITDPPTSIALDAEINEKFGD